MDIPKCFLGHPEPCPKQVGAVEKCDGEPNARNYSCGLAILSEGNDDLDYRVKRSEGKVEDLEVEMGRCVVLRERSSSTIESLMIIITLETGILSFIFAVWADQTCVVCFESLRIVEY